MKKSAKNRKILWGAIVESRFILSDKPEPFMRRKSPFFGELSREWWYSKGGYSFYIPGPGSHEATDVVKTSVYFASFNKKEVEVWICGVNALRVLISSALKNLPASRVLKTTGEIC